MWASLRRSIHWFKVLAPAATRAVPSNDVEQSQPVDVEAAGQQGAGRHREQHQHRHARLGQFEVVGEARPGRRGRREIGDRGPRQRRGRLIADGDDRLHAVPLTCRELGTAE